MVGISGTTLTPSHRHPRSRTGFSMPPYPKASPNEGASRCCNTFHRTLQVEISSRDSGRPCVLACERKQTLKLLDSKDKNRYPWAGGIRGGMITGDGLAGIDKWIGGSGERVLAVFGRPVLDRTRLRILRFPIQISVGRHHPDVITMRLASVQDLGLEQHPKGRSMAS